MSTEQIAKPKKSVFKRWWFWLIVVALVAVAAGKGREAHKVSLNVPSDEESFVHAVAAAQSASHSAQNDMQRGTAKSSRDQAICSALRPQNLAARNWAGTVKRISSNSDGKGVLEIEIAPDIVVKTSNNVVSDSFFSTLIDPSSPVFQVASGMKKGQAVTFSGNFFSDIAKTECLAETSLTLTGKLEEPEFVFKFSMLTPYEASAASASSATSPSAAAMPVSPPVAVAHPTAAVQPPPATVSTEAAPQASTAQAPIAAGGSQESAAPKMLAGDLSTGSDQEMSTVGGTLKIQQADGADRQLLLNGKPLFEGSEDLQWQQPVAKFTLSGGRDAILIASSGGRGNSCEVLYYFLTLSKDIQPKWTPEFGTCTPGGSYKQAGDTITLTIPAVGKMETSVFDGTAVVEDGKAVVLNNSNNPSD